jgi:hypothetical protein
VPVLVLVSDLRLNRGMTGFLSVDALGIEPRPGWGFRGRRHVGLVGGRPDHGEGEGAERGDDAEAVPEAFAHQRDPPGARRGRESSG